MNHSSGDKSHRQAVAWVRPSPDGGVSIYQGDQVPQDGCRTVGDDGTGGEWIPIYAPSSTIDATEARRLAILECAQMVNGRLAGREEGTDLWLEVIKITNMLARHANSDYRAQPSATRRTHDVLLAITHGYSEWEATGDPEKLVKAINEAEIHRQEIAPPQIVTVADVVPVSDGRGET